MKGKLYVIVSVPMIERDFDMYLPVVKKVGALKKLIVEIIENESDHSFVDDGCKNLYDRVTGEQINDNEFLKYSKVENGSKLILY